MKAPRDIDSIISAVTDTFHGLLWEAFSAGRKVGQDDARKELASKMRAVLDDGHERQSTERRTSVAGTSRVRRGSIQPMVISALEQTATGLLPAEIAANTGANENSVRGALNILRKKNITQKQGQRWVLSRRDQTPSLAA